MVIKLSFRKRPANLAILTTFVVLLLLLTALYASEIRFGLIWDDPEWFTRVVGKSILELLQPSTNFQFFRPGIMLFNKLFIRDDGTLAIYLLHWTQIGWYLINLSLIFSISRLVGFQRWPAFMVLILSALHPFVYQAVAWAAVNLALAAMVMNAAWLFYLRGRASKHNGRSPRISLLIISILIFIVALSMNEGAVPLAAVPLLFEIAIRWQQSTWQYVVQSWKHPRKNGWLWPLTYLVAGILFFALWLVVPKASGITNFSLDIRVIAYLLQGFVLAFASSWVGALITHMGLLAALWLGVIGLLWGTAVYRKRGILATTGLAWAILAVLPGLIGLPFSYVTIAPRLFYMAIPGTAWLWVCALWPKTSQRGSATAVFGIIGLTSVAIFGLVTTVGFKRLYAQGTAHMNELVTTLATKNGNYLFINYPDRYRLKEEPLAIGNWGVTLAPVVVDLDEFPALLTGSSAQTISQSMPWVGEESRALGPYQIDMRGVIIQPDELYRLAAEQDGIFVTQYGEDGSFALHYAGALTKKPAEACGTAVFNNALCLHTIQLIPEGNELLVRTTWWTLENLPPHLTIFTHLSQPGSPLIAQADGDSWQSTLPLANWQPGDLIIDERRLPLPANHENLQISIGIYNWVNGERLTGVDAQERPLPDQTVIIPLPID
jgi:hypothetical protein